MLHNSLSSFAYLRAVCWEGAGSAAADGLEAGSDDSGSDGDEEALGPHGGAEAVQEFWNVRREWAESAAAAGSPEDDALPIAQNVGNGVIMFLDPRNPERKLARQSVIRLGTKNESFSMYCYMHQCAKCMKPQRWPSTLQLRRWVKAGMELPSGAGQKSRHTSSFPSG